MAKILEQGFSIDKIPVTARMRKSKYKDLIDALLEHKTLKLEVENPDDLPLNQPGHEAFKTYLGIKNQLARYSKVCKGSLEGNILWLWLEEKEAKK